MSPIKSIRLLFFVAAGMVSGNALAQCDRECLRDHISNYIAAMIAHDPGLLPLAENVKFTEDNQRLQPGEGFWQAATGVTDYRMDFLDMRAGIAGSHIVMEQQDGKALFVLRLKIEGDEITEIETVVTPQGESMMGGLGNLQYPRPEMLHVPTPSKLPSRAEAIRIADLYPAGLKVGSFAQVEVPFAQDAYRFENGGLMAGLECTRNEGCRDILNQQFPVIADIQSRLIAVDEELGIVWYRLDFRRDLGGRSLVVWEAFKVYDGQIHAVEAFMETVPLGTASGWD